MLQHDCSKIKSQSKDSLRILFLFKLAGKLNLDFFFSSSLNVYYLLFYITYSYITLALIQKREGKAREALNTNAERVIH